MIEQIKALLRERNVSNVVIVDDAYDDRPRPEDIEESHWDRFFDDLSKEGEATLREAYGNDNYERRDTTELRRDAAFVNSVWKSRGALGGAAGELFGEFERLREHKRSDLRALEKLLKDDLGLPPRTVGSDFAPESDQAQILFLDLFLGFHEDENAVERALERVKRVVAKRRSEPPIVVLMSANPRLFELGPRLRDNAELLGCQFRMVRKVEFADTETMLERLYELVVAYPDSLRLNTFLQAWTTALDKARKEFLRAIRTLDLADYANMQALILEAEGEPVGDYVIDLYDLYLHNVLEGDKELLQAAKSLNSIKWDTYPPAQFSPSPEVVDIMDGAIFHNQVRTSTEVEVGRAGGVHLGDVFLAPKPAGTPSTSTLNTAETAVRSDTLAEHAPQEKPEGSPVPRHAFVVLSQSCDLQHGGADRVLLMRGEARTYEWKQHDQLKTPRTPIVKAGEERFIVEWDVLAPETWLLKDIPHRVSAEGYLLIRRFRVPFALQLQQAFLGNLGRVGTLAALPARHAVGVKVFIRDAADKALLVAQTAAKDDDAVCLVGRTKKNTLKEWLLFSEKFHRAIRDGLRSIPSDRMPVAPKPLLAALADPEFYRLLKRGIPFFREKKNSKPFQGTAYDVVVQVMTQAAIKQDEKIDRAFLPIVIEIELE